MLRTPRFASILVVCSLLGVSASALADAGVALPKGGVVLEPLPGDHEAQPVSTNWEGEIAGNSIGPDGSTGVVWNKSGEILRVLKPWARDVASRVVAINDFGDVLGESCDHSSCEPVPGPGVGFRPPLIGEGCEDGSCTTVLWNSRGKANRVPLDLGPSAYPALIDLNNRRQILGTFQPFHYYPLVWNAEGELLRDLTGCTNKYRTGQDLNNLGEVVGNWLHESLVFGIIWYEDSTCTDLEDPPFVCAYQAVLPPGCLFIAPALKIANRINDFGLVFGDVNGIAVVWYRDGRFLRLDDPTLPDRDDDGFLNADDECPDSDLRPMVVVGEIRTRALNLPDGVGAQGCMMSDAIMKVAEAAFGRREFIREVVSLTEGWREEGLLLPWEVHAIRRAAVRYRRADHGLIAMD